MVAPWHQPRSRCLYTFLCERARLGRRELRPFILPFPSYPTPTPNSFQFAHDWSRVSDLQNDMGTPDHLAMRLLVGHVGHIQAAAFSPDGKHVATAGGEDGTVRIWRTRFGNVVRVIHAHHRVAGNMSSEVAALRFSHCGQFVFSGGSDRVVRSWRVDVGSSVKTYGGWSGHRGYISEILLAPDGQVIATASGDNSVRFWDVKSGKTLQKHENCHKERVIGAAMSPDGTVLATVGNDSTVRLWDHRPDWLRELVGPFKPLEAVPGLSLVAIAFSRDGALLAAGGSADGNEGSEGELATAIWRLEDGKLLARLPSEDVHDLAFSPCGRYLGIADSRAASGLWSVASRTLLASLPPSKVLAFSADSRLVAVWDGAEFEGADRLRLVPIRRAIEREGLQSEQ